MIEIDEQDEVEIAPGLLRRNLGEGKGELLSVAYGIPLDEPPRPEHAKAVELYSASACDRLAALIEPDPGFRTAKHRRDFRIMIQAWARYVLDRLAAIEDREQARRNERKLAARLLISRGMPRHGTATFLMQNQEHTGPMCRAYSRESSNSAAQGCRPSA